MTPVEFVQKLQNYYGLRYTDVEQPVVGVWVKAFHGSGGSLLELFDRVTTDVSKNFGKIPDKALLQEASSKIKPYDPNALPERPRLTDLGPTDAEREIVVAEMSEIMMGLKYGKRIARSEPYKDE